MIITREIMEKSVGGKPFGAFEPFVTGDEAAVRDYYLASVQPLADDGIAVRWEHAHHGSGYASYASAFLFPADLSTRVETPTGFDTTGLLLYLSLLAPIAVYGKSGEGVAKDNKSSYGGFIDVGNVGLLPEDKWRVFAEMIQRRLRAARIELLDREPLLPPAPEDLNIPTVFDGPYYIFDTLFYWED